MLVALTKLTSSREHSLDPYGRADKYRQVPDHEYSSTRDSRTHIVGKLKSGELQVAKDVDPDRLSFKTGVPAFDPGRVFDEETLAA